MEILKTVISVVFAITIPVLAYLKKSFNLSAAVAACILLLVITAISPKCLLMIIIAFTLTVLAEKLAKKAGNSSVDSITQKTGPRDFMQLVANGAGALVCIILYSFTSDSVFIVAYISAITEALCDSTASAIGSSSNGKVIDICSLKEIPRGLSGGISLIGSLSSTGFAVLMCSISLLLELVSVSQASVILVASVLGCFFDSWLGSKFQVKYICETCNKITEKTMHCGTKTDYYSGIQQINNDIVNLSSNFFSAAISIATVMLIRHFDLKTYIFYVLLLIAVLFCSSVVHETGHLIGCFVSKSKIISLKLPFVLIDFKKKKCSICLKEKNHCLFLTNGPKQLFVSAAAGPVASLIVALVSLILIFTVSNHGFFIMTAVVNFCKVLVNGIPNKKNDGYLIAQALAERNKN